MSEKVPIKSDTCFIIGCTYVLFAFGIVVFPNVTFAFVVLGLLVLFVGVDEFLDAYVAFCLLGMFGI